MQDSRAIHIAAMLNDPGQTFWALCGQGLRDRAYELGVSLTIRPIFTSEEVQAEFSACLHQPDLDALIIVGTGYSLPSDAATRAPRIPVINCNGTLHGIVAACELQPDLRRAAVLAVNYLAERLHGQGRIVHIHGPMHHVTATLPRAEGFAAAMAQHSGMAIAFEAAGYWDQATGAQAMQAALAAAPDVQGVFAHSDAMALGALEVLEAAGQHDVLIVSVDAIPQALSAIHAGRLAATVDTSPYTLGRMALTHALQVVRGQPVPPTVLTNVQLITAANLVDATLATMRVLPNVLRELIAGGKAQRQLQDEIIATQRGLIQELSTPILPVSESVLVMPLIGAIDSRRATQITESLLEAISRHQTQVLIIDITGVAVVDTNVVQHLLQAARAARLLGTTPLLVGISPEVAQTIVQLGVDLSSIVTRSTVQDGLAYAASNGKP
jgi:ribose transport system substrate-binding protein